MGEGSYPHHTPVTRWVGGFTTPPAPQLSATTSSTSDPPPVVSDDPYLILDKMAETHTSRWQRERLDSKRGWKPIEGGETASKTSKIEAQ